MHKDIINPSPSQSLSAILHDIQDWENDLEEFNDAVRDGSFYGVPNTSVRPVGDRALTTYEPNTETSAPAAASAPATENVSGLMGSSLAPTSRQWSWTWMLRTRMS